MSTLQKNASRALRWGSVLAALWLLAQPAARTQEKAAGPITLDIVKYDRLAQEVLKQRGKVVVIDLWQFT
jgi:predicted RNA-binding protein Jag